MKSGDEMLVQGCVLIFVLYLYKDTFPVLTYLCICKLMHMRICVFCIICKLCIFVFANCVFVFVMEWIYQCGYGSKCIGRLFEMSTTSALLNILTNIPKKTNISAKTNIPKKQIFQRNKYFNENKYSKVNKYICFEVYLLHILSNIQYAPLLTNIPKKTNMFTN